MVAAADISPPISAHQWLIAWQTDPLSLTALCIEVVLVGLYLTGVRRLAARADAGRGGARRRSWPPPSPSLSPSGSDRVIAS